jgi:putative sigma-54 modulation protein
MNLNISFKHIESDEEIKTFIEEKSKTLKRYFDGQITVTWSLSAEKHDRIAHCHIVGNNMDYFGEGSTHEFKSSIGLALEKIEKQIRKHKEIVKDHHPHTQKNRIPTPTS